MAVPTIRPEEAAPLHGGPGTVFLDVREEDEVAAGKVAGATTIPLSLVPLLAGERLPKDATVIVYCAAGGRAQKAAEALQGMGWRDVRNMGGYKDWSEAGLPTEKD
ncbi:rhodanese-like domain-containing protein [Wenxinia saemankumensis]|uniref:Rhodanese-related sulfurtransferase n=1 Tax=Wenxinia saemankumensis TaxID=1447782 RepID=A0A1M6HR53_9RHOB|nr:rhodanese-like domain-containing protein [Wenxinia saemankumensis]SHJ24700.1 Rhodanese-related sulfurtransferase [Wenxinia saemankumensis]